MISTTPFASAENFEITAAIDYVTQYVFRGASFAGDSVQPSVQLSYDGFYLSGWGSIALGEEANLFADEYRINGGYNMPLTDTISIDMGATIYHFPDSGGLFDFGSDAGDASTLELFSSLNFDAALNPTLEAYYDLDLKSFTGIGSIEQYYSLTDSSDFLIGAHAGFVTSDTGLDYEWGQVSTGMIWDLADSVSLYGKAHYGISSDDLFIDTNFEPDDTTTISAPKSSKAWFSVGLEIGF